MDKQNLVKKRKIQTSSKDNYSLTKQDYCYRCT